MILDTEKMEESKQYERIRISRLDEIHKEFNKSEQEFNKSQGSEKHGT